jgi:hypothetical protein
VAVRVNPGGVGPLKIGIASTDWSRSVYDENGHPVWGGAGWVRMGQFVAGSRHEVVVGTLGVHERSSLFNVIDWEKRVHLDCDVIVMQRNMFDDVARRMPIARAAGQILVNDIDDWFWGLSTQNDAWKTTHPKANPGENITHYKAILGKSSVVTVSTEYLAERLRQWVRCPIEVIPNVIDVDRFTPHKHHDGVPTVGWVGSTGHRSGDLGLLRGLLRGPAEAGEIKLHHSGHLSTHRTFAAEIGVPLELVTTSPMAAPVDYPSLLSFDIGLAPLTQVPFNEAKCIDADTRVMTDFGLVRAADLKEHDYVWRDGVKRRILAISREEPREGLRITTADGRTLTLTPEHRMRSDGQWITAAEIQPGTILDADPEPATDDEHWGMRLCFDYRPYAHSLPVGWGHFEIESFDGGPKLHHIDATVDERLATVMGAFAGRGWTWGDSIEATNERHAGRMRIEVPIGLHRRVEVALVDLNVNAYPNVTQRDRISFEFNSPALHRAFSKAGLIKPKDGGSYTVDRSVPDLIWQSPARVRRRYLDAYLATQRCVATADFSLPMRDAPELEDIHRLAHSVGLPLRLQTREMMTPGGPVTVHVLSRLPDSVQGNVVTSVEPCTVHPVDIQVDGEEFSLNGFVSHNSWIKAIEYAAAGIPFVATDIEPYRNLYDQYGIGRLARRPKNWISHIRALMDPETRAEEAARNRELVYALDLAPGQKIWDDFFESLKP